MYRTALVLLLLAVPVLAQKPKPKGLRELKIGDKAPDFKLPGIDGRDWSLGDFARSKLLMVYFTSNHCPVCHAHDPRLVRLLRQLTVSYTHLTLPTKA